MEELFYPTYDLSEFSWDSLNHTLNHTALTAELSGVPATDPGGGFANGSLAFRVRPGGRERGNILSKAPSGAGMLLLSTACAVPVTRVSCR